MDNGPHKVETEMLTLKGTFNSIGFYPIEKYVYEKRAFKTGGSGLLQIGIV